MPPVELISAVASTIMSTVLATVALIFTYRQNVGWKPVSLVTGSTISGMGGTWHHTFNIKIEFWNRRKYPINLRSVNVIIAGLEILDSSPDETSFDFRINNNNLYKRTDASIEPNKFYETELSFESEYQSLDSVRPEFTIRIEYFDPIKNKNMSTSISHRFFFPGLGWSKTDEQRRVIEQLFIDMRAEDDARRAAESSSN